MEVQALLRARGARLSSEVYAIKLCVAAASGDLLTIRTLMENGVDASMGDYDGRCALHLAASEGQVQSLLVKAWTVGNA